MGNKKRSSREKIVAAALELFSQQGTTATTTREIAEQAGVNEVTLFRQFGSKQGLLLAVIEDAPILRSMQAALTQIAASEHPVQAYGDLALNLLDAVPELVRSLIGESGQSPAENRQAIGNAIQQANQQTVSYLRQTSAQLPAGLSDKTAASLLNTLILGRAVMDFASEGHGLWQEADFLAAVVELFGKAGMHTEPEQPEAGKDPGTADTISAFPVQDLPQEMVRQLFQKAKKLGPQAYALAYVLFGAGLRLEEMANLTTSQSLSTKNQHLLVVTGKLPRQVPLNRWIAGSRYGSYLKNPLTQWLKSRQDETKAVFIDEHKTALGTAGLLTLWEEIAAETITVTGTPPQPFQARQTWCIELLMKGMSLENLSILSGFSLGELAQYSQRAREKVALEAAIAIDQKNS
ncbi:MAG: TetR family transcriptional regulator [Cyanobacteria bacterium P01_D01_bin.105]